MANSLNEKVLNPLSLPHGNYKFYDYHRLASATFLMHSLLSFDSTLKGGRVGGGAEMSTSTHVMYLYTLFRQKRNFNLFIFPGTPESLTLTYVGLGV